jgi:hypothetical protein
MGTATSSQFHLVNRFHKSRYIDHLHGRTTPQLEKLAQLLNTVMETEISETSRRTLSKLSYTCLGYMAPWPTHH